MQDITAGLLNSPMEAMAKRYEVGARLQTLSRNITSSDISKISVEDLQLLFHCYDQVFFAGQLVPLTKGIIRFSLSRRMTKCAGSTLFPRNFHALPPEKQFVEIRISVDMLFNYDALEGAKQVGGVKVLNSLEALQLVFEHELCHVMEFMDKGKSSCKKQPFRQLSRRLFAHEDSFHQLPTPQQIAREKLGLAVGARVRFHLEGHAYQGIVSNINKRATVMVPDKRGSFRDKRGKCYSKYYVALTALSKV